jgi:hypothetical protein
VGVDCYFYARIHGFHRAKELAVAYRKRLEQEWEEADAGWRQIDADRAEKKLATAKERALLAELELQQARLLASPQVAIESHPGEPAPGM